jgi:hypothetical protein
MQRRERNEGLEPGEHGLVDAHRQGIVETAVDHPMPHADESVARELTTDEREQMIERSVVPERDAVAP